VGIEKPVASIPTLARAAGFDLPTEPRGGEWLLKKSARDNARALD